jgi:hypothetical protein
MSHTRIRRLTAVREEFEATQYATAFFVKNWSALVNTPGADGTQLQPLKSAAGGGLEKTYFIRLFSQFEAELRIFLHEQHRRIPRHAENLINRVTAMQYVDAHLADNVHNVRLYRNQLVHEGNDLAVVVTFTDALSLLNRFLAYLPEP